MYYPKMELHSSLWVILDLDPVPEASQTAGASQAESVQGLKQRVLGAIHIKKSLLKGLLIGFGPSTRYI